MYPRVALLCLLAVTAGCAAPAGDGAPTTGGTDIQNTATPATAPGTTETATPDTPDFSCMSWKPIAGVELLVLFDTSAHLTVTAAESGTTVVDRALSGGERVVYDGSDGVFEPRTEYRVVVRTNGSVRWDRTVRPLEEVRLTVERNGSVTVEGIIVEDTPTPCPG